MQLTDSLSHWKPQSKLAWLLFSLLISTMGCGTTKSFTATEQLLMSDAVDSTISKMDFRALSGHKVFLDTQYVVGAGKVIPGVAMPVNLVNSDYIISGLRQQLTAAGCMLVDTKELAEIVCEARCGALGTDGNSMIYGLPASNFLSTASSVIPGSPALPPFLKFLSPNENLRALRPKCPFLLTIAKRVNRCGNRGSHKPAAAPAILGF